MRSSSNTETVVVSDNFVMLANEITPLLPLYITHGGTFLCDESFYTDREGFNAHILIHTISGSGTVIYHGKEYEIKENQAIVLDCNKKHLYKTCQSPWEFRWVHFNGGACSGYEQLINQGELNVLHVKDYPISQDVMRNKDCISYNMDIIKTLTTSQDAYTQACICHTFISILNIFIKNASTLDSRYKNRNISYLQIITSYIHANFTKKIMLEELVELVPFCKSYLLKLFKQHYQISIYDYIVRVRINHSKILLMQTNHPIGVIATMVGYNESNNFIREFKLKTGITPFRFRKDS